MEKEFLNKVVDQLVYETRIDYDQDSVYTPYHPISSLPLDIETYFPWLLRNHTFPTSSPLTLWFFTHCRDVYGLNVNESDYVYEEYIRSINDKFETYLGNS